MKYANIPAKVPVPFANSGSKNAIPTASQIGITAGAASLTDGFPPLTFTPVAAGGVPPSGKDFNGILNLLSENTQWSNAGAFYSFDSSFASTIGGYPKGAVVLRSDGGGFWQSTVDDNTTDPETSTASGWVPIMEVPTVATGSGAAYVVADSVGSYVSGATYSFVANVANTGTATVDFGAGAISIVLLGGGTPAAGDIAPNSVVELRYDGTNFVLQNPVPARQSQLGSLFTTITDETANRALSTTYTNSSNKPIYINVSATSSSTGAAFTLSATINGTVFDGSSENGANQTEYAAVSAIVPAGATYSAAASSGTPTLTKWVELT